MGTSPKGFTDATAGGASKATVVPFVSLFTLLLPGTRIGELYPEITIGGTRRRPPEASGILSRARVGRFKTPA
ncbi:hypothetical protein [Streptomyces sp. NPDC002845]